MKVTSIKAITKRDYIPACACVFATVRCGLCLSVAKLSGRWTERSFMMVLLLSLLLLLLYDDGLRSGSLPGEFIYFSLSSISTLYKKSFSIVKGWRKKRNLFHFIVDDIVSERMG